MSVDYSPKIITNGLLLALDAGNTKSYPGSGTTWRDLSGQGNNATLVNGTSFDSNLPRSFVFDGTDDYATADSVLTDSFLQGQWTISFWIKFDTISTSGLVGQDRALLHHGTNSNNRGLHLCQRDSKIHFGLYGNDVASSSTVSTDTWYNLVFTLNNSTGAKSILINGSLDNNHTGSAYIGTGSNARIGGEILFGKNFDGNMVMMNAYNRALTVSEIAQNYNALKGRYA